MSKGKKSDFSKGLPRYARNHAQAHGIQPIRKILAKSSVIHPGSKSQVLSPTLRQVQDNKPKPQPEATGPSTARNTADLSSFYVLFVIAFIILGVLFIVSGAFFDDYGGGNTNRGYVADIPYLNISNGNLPPLGNTSAKVTIIEFGDYQCQFCGEFYDNVEGRLKEEYIETGKVKFYYRDMALTEMHEKADELAIAARCANEQGKFWEMHDRIFSSQAQLSFVPETQVNEAMLRYGDELALDNQSFSDCLNQRRYEDKVNADTDYANSLGLDGTPSIIIKIPQNMIDVSKLEQKANSYGGIGLVRDETNYMLIIVGVPPYSLIDSILKDVDY